MSGYGSGRWGWHNTKTAVEDGLSLAISGFKEGLNQVANANSGDGVEWHGAITWSRMQREIASKGYRITKEPFSPERYSASIYAHGGVGPLVYLSFTTTHRDGTKTDSNYPLATLWSRPNFGGRRWRWVCPVGKHNPSFKRRVSKLYLLPPTLVAGLATT
ncbi:MAG TPA: hypothetical protein VF826_17090 [Chloroflexia bacterium]|jgi:hypothetical protein